MMGSFFRFSDRREDTFVAGLSMGGYGALKLALRHPDRFAAAASLSGAVDVAAAGPAAGAPRACSSGSSTASRHPTRTCSRCSPRPTSGALPPLYVSCGTEDPLYPLSVRFADEAAAAGATVTTDFRPGEHEWGLWDDVIQDVIDWLACASRYAPRHEAGADRGRRAERLLRGRLAAGHRRRPGRGRHRRGAAPLGGQGPEGARLRPRRRHQGPPHRPRRRTGRTTPTSRTPGRSTARSAPTARRSTRTSTRSRSTRSSSRASTPRRTPASRGRPPATSAWPTGCAGTR